MAQQSNLLAYLELARTRPGMYFGTSDIHRLRAHLDGWRAHRRFSRDEDGFADRFFSAFKDHVAHHYAETRALGWDRMIADNETPESHFQVFSALLDAFAASGPASKS